MLNSNDLLVNPQFINMSRNEFEDEILIPTFNPVFDLTKSLEKDEIDLLGKGLKYGIKNRNFNRFEILTRFEEFAQDMEKEKIIENNQLDKYETTGKESFLQKIQTLTYDFVDSAETPQNSLTFDEENTLRKLCSKVKDESLVVSKADKGNATVVLKKEDYINKMEAILSDRSKFELLENQSDDLIQKTEDSFNSYLYSIKDEHEKVVVVDSNGKTSTVSQIKKKKSIRQY